MAKYRYAGPGPVEDPDDHTIVRPGDVREMESCAWGPWVLTEDGDGAETPADVPPAPPPAGEPETPPAASTPADNTKES